MIDAELKKAFAVIDKIDPSTARAVAAGAIPYCKEYCAIKPFIPLIIKLVGGIPILGPRVAVVLTVLNKIASAVCQCSK